MKWPVRTRSRRHVVFVTLAMLALAPIVAAGCANRLIMPPQATARVGDDVQRRMIPYARGKGQLEVFESRSAGAATTQPVAMVMQFSGGNAADVARTLASRWNRRPVGIWAINYPGYGRSTGRR